MSKSVEEQIRGLTQIWYEYVSFDHHKDRDCHWYIHQVWSYGDKPYWEVWHGGYVSDCNDDKHYASHDRALEALLRLIQSAFNSELEWARDVLMRKMEYDKVQVEKAEWLEAQRNKLRGMKTDLQKALDEVKPNE